MHVNIALQQYLLCKFWMLLHMHFLENEGFVKMDSVVKVKVKVKFAH